MCSPSAPPPQTDPASPGRVSPGQVPSRLDAVDEGPALSRTQRLFNRWIERIDEQRRQLAQWQAFAAAFQSRVARDYEPLQRKCHAQRFMLLRRFDQAHDSDALSRREQKRLARVIVEQVSAMLESQAGGGDDPVLIGLHDKYSEVRYDEIRRASTGPASAAAADAADAMGHAAADAAADAANAATAGGPRSARAEARAERARALAEAATQSVREAWRRLASALHPDREPDPVERERKTVLMQRANLAYEARDLLQLLALQVEAEQIDLRRLAEAGEARVARYNRVLKEQSEGLAAEIEAIIARHATGGGPRRKGELTPAAIMAALDRDIADVRQRCRWLAQDLEAFKDIGQIKAWLAALQTTKRSPVE